MDTRENEIAELKGFIAELKADRAAQKEKEQREAWTKYTSLSIVVIAVLAAVANEWLGKYGGRVLVELNKSVFSQAQASDAWNEFQANSIKQNLYEAIQDSELKTPVAQDKPTTGRDEAFKAKISKYAANKEVKQKEARAFEEERETARKAASVARAHGESMGYAVAIFQISIALGSICLVTKRKPIWFLSLLFAVFASWKMLQVWFN
jgi:hypothetical protein